MGLRINQNIAAQNAYRNLSVTDNQMAKSLEKLSSGFRINRAADDAAGLSISEGLRAQIGGLKQAVRNAQDGVNVVQTADGALTETHAILQRMRSLAVQASNGGSQDAKAQDAANTEFGQLKTELDRISNTTSFGTQKLLDGSYGLSNQSSGSAVTAATNVTSTAAAADTLSFGIKLNGSTTTTTVNAALAAGSYTSPDALVKGLNTAISTALKAAGGTGNEVQLSSTVASDGTGVTFKLSSSSALTGIAAGANLTLGGLAATTTAGTGSSGVFQVGANNVANERIQVTIGKMDSATLGVNTVDLTSTTNAQAAISAVDSAIGTVSTARANLGAYQNRFEHTINNLNVTIENLSSSESQIRDTDMASEMVSYTRSQILSQAGTAMLAQANQAPQGVLKLLG